MAVRLKCSKDERHTAFHGKRTVEETWTFVTDESGDVVRVYKSQTDPQTNVATYVCAYCGQPGVISED